ncbi:SusC/RagA family TonB-linked outer membrane protein [Tenacibaculum sp. 190524A02b]|uniref:SusC/RagA family TonB-linked outer membrane protein n=1 Tax=Tenacibaculum vairaonense TaxID=3137860 RepID=UPI0031FB99E4
MKTKFNGILTLLLAFVVQITFAQEKTISGTVSDESGPLPGVTVLKKGTSQGTETDFDGKYSIKAKTGDVLVFSFVGMKTTEKTVSASNTINVTMEGDNVLDEVIVTGLGMSKKEKAIGYAVQKVDGEKLAESREPNIINALQGSVAGVQIQGSASSLGGSARITIRGSNSFLGNNQPLFVVDGVPIDNSNFANSSQQRGFGGGAYDYGNQASDIDPSNIASMSVLKGAAATALYGSRGANGVILITTKTGKGQKGIGVTYDASVSFDNAANLIPIQTMYGGGSTYPTVDADGFTTGRNGFKLFTQDGVEYLAPNYGKDGSWGPKFDPNIMVRHWDSWDPASPNYKETRPWVAPANSYDNYFDTGVTLTNSVSLAGSNEKGAFRLGYTNLNTTGTTPKSKMERNTINLNSSYKLSDKLKASLVMNYVRTDAENRNATGYDNSNPMQAFTQWWQSQLDVERLRDRQKLVDGRHYTWNIKGITTDRTNNNQLTNVNLVPNFFDNPFWVRENYLQGDVKNRLYGNAGLSYDITDELSISTQFGTDWYQLSMREGIPHGSVSGSDYTERERKFQETNMEVKLNYNTHLSEDLSLTAIIGANRMTRQRKLLQTSANGGLVIDKFFNIGNSSQDPTTFTEEFNKGINSVFGTASFGWKDMLFLDLSARNDWSSTLPADANSFFYPAASLSFALSELPGLKGNEILNFAKIRASVAQAGNDSDEYRLTDVFEPYNPNFGGTPIFFVPNSRQNPTLVNELTTEYEFGFLVKLFNNRITLDAAYYNRLTEDQIFNANVSSASGYDTRLLNAGSMRNSGFEIQLNATPIVNDDFRWDIGINATKQKNEVVDLFTDETGKTLESLDLGGTWAADLRVQKGRPYMALFGQDYIYDANGNKVVGADGMYKFTDERVYLGSALADWTGGFNTSFSYKGLTLSGLFDFQVGGVMHSSSLQWSKYSGMHPESVAFNGESDIRANGMILPGVKEDGTPNDIRVDPQTYYQTHWRKAAPNTYKASFLKLREIKLNYNLPARFLENTPISSLSFGVFGRNLAILAADLPYLDPQGVTSSQNRQGLENAQVPSTRSFGFNISTKF